jgi:hypothetical protein
MIRSLVGQYISAIVRSRGYLCYPRTTVTPRSLPTSRQYVRVARRLHPRSNSA